jgi:hypothetical protein
MSSVVWQPNVFALGPFKSALVAAQSFPLQALQSALQQNPARTNLTVSFPSAVTNAGFQNFNLQLNLCTNGPAGLGIYQALASPGFNPSASNLFVVTNTWAIPTGILTNAVDGQIVLFSWYLNATNIWFFDGFTLTF